MIKQLLGASLTLAMTTSIAAAASRTQSHVDGSRQGPAKAMAEFQALAPSRGTASSVDAPAAGAPDPNDYRLGYFRNF